MAEMFTADVCSGAAELAKHRKSKALEAKDILLYLGTNPSYTILSIYLY